MNLEAIFEELKTLPPHRLAQAADYIHPGSSRKAANKSMNEIGSVVVWIAAVAK